MRRGQVVTIGNAAMRVNQSDLGSGGQSQVHKVSAAQDANLKAALKILPHSRESEARLSALIQTGLGAAHPYLCAPLAMALEAGEIRTLACFAEGAPMDEDRPRALPELLEIAIHAACLWIVTEEAGVAHGDIAPSNVHISQRGSVRLIDFDNAHLNSGAAPPPTMIGQPMMLAPELWSGAATPNRLSDRFAWGVLLSWLLLGRHPADGLAENPAERNKIMGCGYWPERDRSHDPQELSITVLGAELGDLFDQAFSILPADRPSADDWRRGLMQALRQTVVHGCGFAFVHDGGLTSCPECGGAPPSPLAQRRPDAVAGGPATLTILNIVTGEGADFTINDGDRMTLGRADIPGASPQVSGRHLEIRRFSDRLFLRHIGRNPTVLEARRQRLTETWLRLGARRQAPLSLTLADTKINIIC